MMEHPCTVVACIHQGTSGSVLYDSGLFEKPVLKSSACEVPLVVGTALCLCDPYIASSMQMLCACMVTSLIMVVSAVKCMAPSALPYFHYSMFSAQVWLCLHHPFTRVTPRGMHTCSKSTLKSPPSALPLALWREAP
jgi:hypothetical protein